MHWTTKALVVIAFLTLPGVSAAAAAPSGSTSITLRCIGYMRKLNDTIGHDVVIDGARATVDGQPYTVTTEPTRYWLKSVDQKKPIALSIDRINGAYNFFSGQALSDDWSRPEDPGCKAVKTLF